MIKILRADLTLRLIFCQISEIATMVNAQKNNDALVAMLKDPAQRNRAFSIFMKQYGRKLYWHIRRIVVDHDDAEDEQKAHHRKRHHELTAYILVVVFLFGFVACHLPSSSKYYQVFIRMCYVFAAVLTQDEHILVPDADLPQLDAGPEHAGQVPHQLPEVHPAVGGKEEHGLVPLEIAFHIHQAHIQAVLGDLLLADLEGLLLPALIQLRYPEIVRRGDAHHIAQELH